jgi:hypothetical protein
MVAVASRADMFIFVDVLDMFEVDAIAEAAGWVAAAIDELTSDVDAKMLEPDVICDGEDELAAENAVAFAIKVCC